MKNDTQAVAALDPDRLRLLKARLGRLFYWKRPAIIESVGPYMPEVFERFENELHDIVAKCCVELNRYTDEQVTNILSIPKDDATYAKSWASFLKNEVYDLDKRIPEWHSGGFGHPDHVADFDHWTKMPRFDVGELTCLTVGIGPNEFSWKQLHSLSTSKYRSALSKPLEFLVLRYEQLHRKFCRYGRDDAVMPRDFIEWVDQFEFEVHPGFLERLKRFHPIQGSSTPAAAPRKHDKREVDSIAQLFTAMAIEQFGYVPDSPRSPTTKEIASLAASLGISITEDTILKYLRIGATYISSDWKPHER